MALDMREIKKTVIDSVKASIGSLLTQETNQATQETYGLVMLARPNPEKPIPAYPYAVLDLLSVKDDDWHTTNFVQSEVTGDFQYETHKELEFQITIYGGDAIAIAEQLATSYRRDDILLVLKQGSIALRDVETVTINPELLQTDFLEVGVVKLSIRANDIYIDPNIECIEDVVMAGTLERYEGDPDPLTVNVDTR